MNDKQREIALEMAVSVCQMVASISDSEKAKCVNRSRELLAAFDAAADAPKPSVGGIRRQSRSNVNDLYYIYYNDKFVWGGHGWTAASGFGYGYPKETAEMIYAGLVATGNVPEVGE